MVNSDKSLEKWIWDAACSIRGAKDAPKYRDFILPLIFAKRLFAPTPNRLCGREKYRHLNLEQNFWDWLDQARLDFRTIWSARDVDLIAEQADKRFAAQINRDRPRDSVLATATISTPKVRRLTETPARPWRSTS